MKNMPQHRLIGRLCCQVRRLYRKVRDVSEKWELYGACAISTGSGSNNLANDNFSQNM